MPSTTPESPPDESDVDPTIYEPDFSSAPPGSERVEVVGRDPRRAESQGTSRKRAIVEDLVERMRDAEYIFVIHDLGLSVAEIQRLRGEMGEEAVLRRVKNTLARRAALTAGIQLADFAGPSALIFVNEAPSRIAKIIVEWANRESRLELIGGFECRHAISREAVQTLATLGSRAELLAQAAGAMKRLVARPAIISKATLSVSAQLVDALRRSRS